MKTLLKLNPSVRWNLLVLFAAGLMFWAGLALLLPGLPLYIQAVGGSGWQIGVTMGCFAIGLLLSKAWLSRLADERGRKIVLIIGISAIALAPIGYVFTESIPMLMAVRAFHGISIAAFATAYSALVVDVSPPQNRGELVGYMSLVNPLGLALGPALGGFLYEWFGFTPFFIASAVLGFIGLGCTLKVRESYRPPTATLNDSSSASNSLSNRGDQAQAGNPVQKSRGADSGESAKFWSLLLTDRVRIPATVLLLVGLAFGTISTFVPLLIEEADIGVNAGLFYTTSAIASFSIRLVTGRASDRYGRGRFITLSLILYSLSMFLLWQVESDPAFLLAGLLQGAGAGMLIPMIAVLMADRSHPSERGRMFGLCMVGFDLGIALAGPILGLLATWIGYRTIFGISSAMLVVGLFIFLTLSSKDLYHSLRFALSDGQDVYAVDAGHAFDHR